MKHQVLVDGRIFSLQEKGGISQMWAYMLKDPNWQRNVATKLIVYPGHHRNVHLKECQLLDDAKIKILSCALPPGDNGNFASPEYSLQRRQSVGLGPGSKVDAVVTTYYGDNFFPDCKNYLVTALDFAHEEVEELQAKPSTRGVIKQKQKAFSSAGHISFISDASRKKFFRHYPAFDIAKTSVIHLGHASNTIDAVKAGGLVLHVGSRLGYKNFQVVAEGVAIVMKRESHVRFFIMGGEPADATVSDLLERFPGRVYFNQRPTDHEMDFAMAIADIFVSASKYEGFGIPLLNALRFGTRPVVSDIPPYREIASSLAEYFPPGSARQLSLAVEAALTRGNVEARTWRPWSAVAADYVDLMDRWIKNDQAAA